MSASPSQFSAQCSTSCTIFRTRKIFETYTRCILILYRYCQLTNIGGDGYKLNHATYFVFTADERDNEAGLDMKTFHYSGNYTSRTQSHSLLHTQMRTVEYFFKFVNFDIIVRRNIHNSQIIKQTYLPACISTVSALT